MNFNSQITTNTGVLKQITNEPWSNTPKWIFLENVWTVRKNIFDSSFLSQHLMKLNCLIMPLVHITLP